MSPPWIPTDRRTSAYRLYDKARWSIGTSLASIAANKLYDYYRSPRAPPPQRSLFRSNMRFRKRTRYSRRSFKGKRARRSTFRARRRGVSRKFIAGRGPLQLKYPKATSSYLNTRMLRNDYDSTREITSKSVVVASTSAITLAGYNFAVYDFPLALTKLFDYDEYMVKDIQMVITPLRISRGEQDLTVVDSADPYFYVAPRVHPETITSTPSLNVIKSTPGVMRFHMLRKKPVVINLPNQLPQEDEIIGSATGTSYTVRKPMRTLRWIHNPQDSGPVVDTNYPNMGNVFIYVPQIQSGDYQPKWRVDYYATICLRGNRALLDV